MHAVLLIGVGGFKALYLIYFLQCANLRSFVVAPTKFIPYGTEIYLHISTNVLNKTFYLTTCKINPLIWSIYNKFGQYLNLLDILNRGWPISIVNHKCKQLQVFFFFLTPKVFCCCFMGITLYICWTALPLVVIISP